MASKSQNDFGAFSFCLFLFCGQSDVFAGGFAISTREDGGFWMVICGVLVIRTWLFSARFSAA
jgi:hypothetical protein